MANEMQRIDGEWSRSEAIHLLWRTGFGASADEIQQATQDGLDKTLDRLLSPPAESAEFGKADALLRQAAFDSGNIADLKTWWLHRMVASTNPLVEKLTLLWHNHFATSNAKVDSVSLMAAQNDLLRRESLGSFRPVLHGIAKDVAMLLWLDSNSNRKRHPNENFSREVMELFSLGVGNYSEHDIQEAARAFTGWYVRDGEFWFNAIQHDTGEKVVFTKRGNFDGGDVVELCLEHPACPRFLAFKLLRQFVEPSPSKEHIDALAARIRQHNFEWRPILRELFASRLFFSEPARQSIIKSPVELLLGAVRQLKGKPNLQAIAWLSAELGQDIFEPPTVKGWDGGRLWISSTTLIQRANFATALLKSNQLGSISFAGLRVEDDVNYFVELLLARDVGPDAVAELRQFMKNQTGDPEIRLRSLVQFMMQMPEYQLT
ncbi:MAG: DUF1800 domain-containing protein [Planctomycetota bacterium]|nr:MAG: DUF1800 domain-containing protein [Planctomycetota bacterium]GDY07758.1 hypothetical protein LBMAG52_12440 [Planctomycetia bacterium]